MFSGGQICKNNQPYQATCNEISVRKTKGCNRKFASKNRTILKLWHPSEVASTEDNGSIKHLDEFTLSALTFEAAFSDGSKVLFRRDCFHRLLTVPTGSSVVIDDTPFLQQQTSGANVTSSLSAAFTSCNGTGLAWLSPEARVVYSRALEVLAHCEKLETALVKVVDHNEHLTLPFVIGRSYQQPNPINCSQSLGTCISPNDSTQLEPFYSFHGSSCPYCKCSRGKRAKAFTFNSNPNCLGDYDPTGLEPGLVIEVGCSKDFSSSGIASKSVSPPNFGLARDVHLRNLERQASDIGSYRDTYSCEENDEASIKGKQCPPFKKLPNCSKPKLAGVFTKGKTSPITHHCKAISCSICLGDAIGKMGISGQLETSVKTKSSQKLLKPKNDIDNSSIFKKTKRQTRRGDLHNHHVHVQSKRNRGTTTKNGKMDSKVQVSCTDFETQQVSSIKKSPFDNKLEYTGTPVTRFAKTAHRRSAPIRLTEESPQDNIFAQGQILIIGSSTTDDEV